MTATAQMRGHPVYWDGAVWRHQDDDTLAPASGGAERPCTKCGLIAEGDYGPDPCLGHIEGITGACCGHGVESIPDMDFDEVTENIESRWGQREHDASADCWCHPYQNAVEPLVWIHRKDGEA